MTEIPKRGEGDNADDEDHGKKKSHSEPALRKEVLTIWGRTEVPKLFSMSHNSHKMHKNIQ